MDQAAEEGREPPEEELQQLVGETVLEGIMRGVRLGDDADQAAAESRSEQNGGGSGRRPLRDGEHDGDEVAKRSRLED